MENTGNYKIVKSQLPLIGGIAGHNFIAVLDPNNRVIHELNGLATSKDGEIKPIGYLPSDKLYVYNEKEVKGFLYNSSQNQEVVFEGNYKDVMDKFNLGYAIGKEINKHEFTYPFFGLGDNSNSVASTLLKGMGLNDPDLGHALTPGEESLLIPEEQLRNIRQNWELQHKKVSANLGEIGVNFAESALTAADKLQALIQGFKNDKDGAFTTKALAENADVVANFRDELRETLKQNQTQEVAQNVPQVQEERSYGGRSFG